MSHRDGRWFYLLLGAGSLTGYFAASLLVSSDHSTGDLLLFLGLFLGLSAIWGVILYRARHTPPPLLPVIVFAILFRLAQRVILYEDDVWRYLWEGHVRSAGVNPLQVAPEALEAY